MTTLPRKTLLHLKEINHPLFTQKRDDFYKSEEGKNSHIRYGDYIAEVTADELADYYLETL